MNYLENVKASLMMFCDDKYIEKVANDKNAIFYGIITLLIAGLSSGIGYAVFEGDYILILFAPIILLAGVYISKILYYGVANLLGAKGDIVEFLRVMSCAYVYAWIGVLLFVPFLGDILSQGLGMLFAVMMYKTLVKNHEMSKFRAVVVAFLPLILLGVLLFLFFAWILFINLA